jgi:hypothetical protein
LLRLVKHLPKYSRYWVARAEDDELAEMLLRQKAPAGPPRLESWGPYDELITAIREEGALTRYTIKATTPGIKPQPKQPKPMPRPVGAMQRAERRDDQRKHDFIVNQVLPGR